ncbi:hypothetical protein [Saccharothrix sp. Mg75]|uniref:hypothetical protein n=1 Tax=Saccharothrix sp. Mg75 TaxID=3445357 RepID=UPI003EE8C87F
MRAFRWVLGALGVAAGLWGAVLLLPLLDVDLLVWFLGGPVAHDLLLAPLVGGVGLAVARWVAAPWRVPVVVGGVLSGVLVLLAVPLLWRPHAGPANPGLHDRAHGPWLLAAVAAIWLGVLVTGLVRGLVRERKGPHSGG